MDSTNGWKSWTTLLEDRSSHCCLSGVSLHLYIFSARERIKLCTLTTGFFIVVLNQQNLADGWHSIVAFFWQNKPLSYSYFLSLNITTVKEVTVQETKVFSHPIFSSQSLFWHPDILLCQAVVDFLPSKWLRQYYWMFRSLIYIFSKRLCVTVQIEEREADQKMLQLRLRQIFTIKSDISYAISWTLQQITIEVF